MTRNLILEAAASVAGAEADGQPIPLPEMTDEETAELVSIGYAEHFAGYERRSETGKFEWRMTEIRDDQGNVLRPLGEWVEQLPTPTTSGFVILDHLDQWARKPDSHLIWTLNTRRLPEDVIQYVCAIGINLDGKMKPMAFGRANVVGAAVAVAMLNAVDFPWRDYHMLVFPGRYFAGIQH